MEAQTKNCQNCKQDFTIEPNDFGFYEKIKVPPPTFCPDCRRQRRWAWRNNMSLYSRRCDSCDKPVVSLYSPDSGLIIYCNKCWWGDKWDPRSYGIDYDFSKTFFSQLDELAQRVPQMTVVNDDGIASVNCQYTQDWWFSKNCYMCFSGWYVENVMYSFFILAGKNILDSLIIRTTSEWLYECFITSKSYQVKYSELCLNCINSQFLFDCRNCSDCFMCTGLRGKKYHFKNQAHSPEKYREVVSSYKLDTWSGVEKTQKEFEEFKLKYPRKCPENLNCVATVGEYNSFSKYLNVCFYGKSAERCSYSEFFSDGNNPSKDCCDITITGGASECYECVVGDHSELNLFGFFSVKSQDIKYCQHCHNCKYCFGCVGLRNAKYCIFNKQYTKEEYEKLVPKIIEHMNEMPYVDTMGSVYKYGEFYPIELSPFGYNETYAPEITFLTKEEAKKRGYNWQDNIQRTTSKETLLPENIPDGINEVGDSILDEVLVCTNCERNYKIVQNELIFYKKMQIPIPRKCFHCRHQSRIEKRNPFKLWHRQCMCGSAGSPSTTVKHEHEGQCKNEFETSYAPDRPEIVYCEKCYQAEVY